MKVAQHVCNYWYDSWHDSITTVNHLILALTIWRRNVLYAISAYVMTRIDASYSRSYLRRDNYFGERLLKHIQGRDPPAALGVATFDLSRNNTSPPTLNSKMENEDDQEVYRQPDSSDEEDAKQSKQSTMNRSTTSLLRKAKNESSTTPKPSPKRGPSTAAASRSKRRKIQDESSIDSLLLPEPVPGTELFSEFNSSSSQKRKQNRTYAQRKAFAIPEPVDVKGKAREKKPAFVKYDELELKEKRPAARKRMVIAAPPLDERESSTKVERKRMLEIPDFPQEDEQPKGQGFRMPNLPEFASSATTIETEIASTFEAPMTPADGIHSRSNSTSSLSSARSPSPLAHDIDLPPVSQRCPICRKFVADSTKVFVPESLRKLSFKDQQHFCLQHQIAEAKDLWEQKRYPEIDWEDLEHNRIPAKISLLNQTISRERNSFYLDELDRRLKEARGSRKQIHAYLSDGIVDVAKPGYYGLKGSRIMVSAITEILTDSLVAALQTDSAIRNVGAGAYISSVLVPELTLLLVMEDLNLKDPNKGRQVLDESSHVGVLLNPDDEHIERTEDDV